VEPAAHPFDYYQQLGLTPTASHQAIREAHRELSRRYHPDTSHLPPAIARAKFQQIQEAYHVLSSREQRFLYDLQRQSGPDLGQTLRPDSVPAVDGPRRSPSVSSVAELPAIDRPFSGGELFALLSLGLTLVLCLGLAILLALARGEELMPQPSWQAQAQDHSQVQAISVPIESLPLGSDANSLRPDRL
jgi:hypothetical protein